MVYKTPMSFPEDVRYKIVGYKYINMHKLKSYYYHDNMEDKPKHKKGIQLT